ncbi:hypothetical protein MMC28_010365, partial [Mycoblastus sanguinarius]|nr:hypothetical protein [Mycoblastus sanguinarius]
MPSPSPSPPPRLHLHLYPFLLLLPSITALIFPHTTTQYAREKVAACLNTTIPPDPTCWDALDMATWMSSWNTSTAACTAADRNWGTCFMRLTFQGTETETSGAYNCTTINATDMGGAACTMPMPGAIVQGPAEIFYGAYSIW